MSVKIKPPEFKEKNYERYRVELEAWREITDLAKSKQGIAIALSLPEDSEQGIREKVFDELSIDDLKTDTGLDTLLAFLDTKLKKDDLADMWDKFDDFEEYRREQGQSIADYISKFDHKYKKLLKQKMKLPSEILAFKLLKNANITTDERLLVLTGMNYDEKETLYEQAQASLKKFQGDQVKADRKGTAIQLSAAYLAENEDALLAAGFVRRNASDSYGRGKRTGQYFSQGGRGRGRVQGRGNSFGNHNRTTTERAMNPKNAAGRVLTCISCGSYRHLIADCPHSWENLTKAAVVENECLFTGGIKQEVQLLGDEAVKCVVLDCACSSTVCGEKWLDDYIQSLNKSEKLSLQRQHSDRMFRFGGGEILKSQGAFDIPATLAGKKITIHTDVVTSDIPLLLSLKAMKKAKIKLNLENDSAEIFGKTVVLNHTSSGHYCLPINGSEFSVSEIFAVQLSSLDDEHLYQKLLKLHRQFAHPPRMKLVSLLKDAQIWRSEYMDVLKMIEEKCELCKTHKKTPPRPAVCLPMAAEFNEKVAMDLKSWSGRWILHIIDMWSRLTVSKFIPRKKPSDVIDTIMLHWVGAGYGVMQAMLTDNGGEFTSEESREVASILNVQVCTTAAESPFQNGLCERVHAVTDSMLLKMIDQCPKTPVEVLLAWATMARNALQMWHGFSSYQLVFGKNPNLPNIMEATPPALEGSTSSAILAQHLNALHEARKSFIQSEASERIRRALRTKIRSSEETFEHGDNVYYKREGHDRWLGPARVIFQDGKVIFVRHGSVFVRVSPNRLIKTNYSMTNTKENIEITSRGDEFVHPKEKAINDRHAFSEEFSNTVPQEHTGPVNPVPAFDKEAVSSRSDMDVKRYPKKNDVLTIQHVGDSVVSKVRVLSRAGKSSGKHKDWFNVKDVDTGTSTSVNLKGLQWDFHVDSTQKNDVPNSAQNDSVKTMAHEHVNIVLVPKEDHNNADCLVAKQEELLKLKSFRTYEEVPNKHQETISTTWVLWMKGDAVRARLVARGYEENCSAPTDSPTVSKSGLRIFFVVTNMKKWKMQATDIKSAFLQGKKLARTVYVKPPTEADTADGFVWKLNHCLYGLNDAARQFYDSVREELLRSECHQSKLDPALFYFEKDGELHGIFACHVDDFLHAGSSVFQECVIDRLKERFIVGKFEENVFSYVGFEIEQIESGIMLQQNQYVDNIENPCISSQRLSQKKEELTNTEYTQLRSIVGRLNWVAQGTRPDLAYDVVDLSTKFKNACVHDLIRATKNIRKLKQGSCTIFYPFLAEIKTWRIIVFSDASHANLSDGVSSMGGHIVFLADANNHCCVLSWQANKIKRIVRSTIAAEALSLQEGLEDAIFHQNMLLEIFGQQTASMVVQAFPIDAIVDNKSVIEAINSTKMVDDRRLRIDISTIKESLSRGEIRSVKWCPGSYQLANCLTKRGAQCSQLIQTLQKGKLIEQWI